MPAPASKAPPAHAAKISSGIKTLKLDAISLEQALVDVEIANGRVMELTRRLTSAAKEITTLRGQLAGSRIPELESELQATKSELAALRLQRARDLALVNRPG
jgi:hypothetical protein